MLVFLLLLVVILHVGGEAYDASVFSSALDEQSITILCGKGSSPTTRRKSRGLGYRLRATSVLDKDGNAYSAKGDIYIISSLSDVDYGDEVALAGTMGEGYFLSQSTELLYRSPYSLVRRRFSSLLLRLFPIGEKGNLTALLLTGSSLDGTTNLTNLARQYGLSYILALSGMHLALLSLPLRPLFRFLGGIKWGDVATIFLLTFFVYSTGWKPSLIRALFFLILSTIL
ncbi:MAG: ComEC/Rec2 family competence protein, partial [Spirochaetales bacterium]|nr:ComEC/Rec2 family competence protein [Candidatus Physcosoma equi]